MSQRDPGHSSSEASASRPNGASGSPPAASPPEVEMAQAFRDLARGEQHAAALERNLTSLENKLDAFLAQFEESASGDLDSVSDKVEHGGEAAEKPEGKQ